VKTITVIFLVAIVLLTFFASPHVAAKNQNKKIVFPFDSLQMVLVITPNLNASSGIIHFFEREHTFAPWNPVNKPEKVVVGKNGLGWEPNLHALGYKAATKKEGDGKAPAGIFYLSSIFGYALAKKMSHLKMPYLHTNNTLVCVDDANSVFYNRIVDSSFLKKKDWKSHEKMKRNDDLYRLGVVVDYNLFPTIKGKGSCIFLHIWRGKGSSVKPTLGCTAMVPRLMEKLILWLELDKKPVLVQLPQSEFESISKGWCLPTKNLVQQRTCEGEANEGADNAYSVQEQYFLDASTRQLTPNDLAPVSKQQLRIMKNAIFARHGYIFKNAAMKNYFSTQPWYHPQFHNVYHLLTPIERDNVNLIKRYEK